MNGSRRSALHFLGTGLIAGLAGCSSLKFGGKQEYAPVTLENNHDTKHVMSVAVTSIPGTGLGHTEYFSETWLVDSGAEHTFEEGLAFSDHAPQLQVLIVLENETAKRAKFRFSSDLSELRVRVTEGGDIEVQTNRE